jgi:hypothetical protein
MIATSAGEKHPYQTANQKSNKKNTVPLHHHVPKSLLARNVKKKGVFQSNGVVYIHIRKAAKNLSSKKQA